MAKVRLNKGEKKRKRERRSQGGLREQKGKKWTGVREERPD